MKYLNEQDIKLIESSVEKLVDDKCLNNFNSFSDNMLNSFNEISECPQEIYDKLKIFLNDQKHLFYRGYREKIIENMKNRIKKSIVDVHFKSTVEVKDFNEIKNRLFMEAYFNSEKNATKAAGYINVSKSTYHDWLKTNRELISSEERKSLV